MRLRSIAVGLFSGWSATIVLGLALGWYDSLKQFAFSLSTSAVVLFAMIGVVSLIRKENRV